MELRNKIERLAKLRDRKAELQEELSKIQQEIDVLTAEINEEMLLQGIQHINIDGIGTVYLSSRLFASCTQENLPKLQEWLKQIGAEGLLRPYIPNQTLSALVRERMEKGEAIPDFINVTVKPGLNIRRR